MTAVTAAALAAPEAPPTIGPVQLIALGVSGPDFRLVVAGECRRLGATDAVRVLDAAVVRRGERGQLVLEQISASGTDEPLLSREHAREVLDGLPPGGEAVLLLVEHHWALPIRDALTRAGAFRLRDCFVSPVDLVDLGLLASDDADETDETDDAGSGR